MSTAAVWAVIVVIGLGTFLFRLSGIQLFGAGNMPPALMRALRYVPPAVLAAIVVPAIVYGGPTPGFAWDNARLLAGLLAGIVAWTTRNVLATLGVGMVSLWLIEWVIP